MNPLISIQNQKINDELIPTVNARDLHSYLEVGRDFTSWLKGRIQHYKFIENLDFTFTLTKSGERKNVNITEYHLSLDMAKELCMVENNDKGQEARRYFIAMEKKAKGGSVSSTPLMNPVFSPHCDKGHIEFQGKKITVHFLKGERWINGVELDLALGFRKNSKVIRAYHDNIAKFNDSSSRVLTVFFNGKHRPIRMFSPEGAALIINLVKNEQGLALSNQLLNCFEGQKKEQSELPLLQIGATQIDNERYALEFANNTINLLREILVKNKPT